jgi:hypothetical protein
MTKPKINHPFQVPDDFFDHLEKELLMKTEMVTFTENRGSVFLQILKYAAIIVGAIFLGRESVKYIPENSNSSRTEETISVDLVLSQVSDEDITNFLLDNVTMEIPTE